MDTTSLKLGDSYAECKADAARYVPTGWCSWFLVSLRVTWKKKNLRHLRMKNARKFSVTYWESVEDELSDDEYQLQLPIYRRH